MKKILRRNIILSFTILLCSLVSTQQARASHAMGADLSFACIDSANLVYRVTYTFYRDCASYVFPPTTIPLSVTSVSCGQNFTATLVQDSLVPNPYGGAPGEVSSLCPSLIKNSTCNGGEYPGVERYVYTAIVTLPQVCTDWTFSDYVSARNNAITNLNVSLGPALYVQATLNNVLARTDDSPIFTTLPTPYFCDNQPVFYNHGGVDPNGDSLVYSMINPLDAGAVPIPYNPGYSVTQPLITTGPFVFNTATGEMSFKPFGQQNAVVTILVQEYRNGQLIGSTMRDIQLVVVDLEGCSNPPTPFNGITQLSLTGGVFENPYLIQACPGNTVAFNAPLRSLGADSVFVADSIFVSIDSVFMSSNISQSIPGASFNIIRASADSLTGFFNWPTTEVDTGFHSFVVVISDNHCPIANSQAYAISVDVIKGTNAGPDLHYCPSGGPLQLNVTGGSHFTWSPSTGLSNDTISNPLASPAQTTTYVVTSNLPVGCKSTDTVTVFRVADFNFSMTQSKDTICLNDIVYFNITGDPAFGPYQYLWSPSTGLNSDSVANPYSQPMGNTRYDVLIRSDSTGCTRADTATVIIRGVGPHVLLNASPASVCVGDTIQLSSFISTTVCSTGATPCTSGTSVKTAGTGSVSNFDTPTPYLCANTSGRIQLLYTAGELKALGMGPGTISAIGFDIALVNSDPNFIYRNFTISIGCTEEPLVTGFSSGLSQVYFSQSQTMVQAGWNTYPLNTPYSWDGASNLLVQVCFTTNLAASSGNNDLVYATTTTFNSVAYAQIDGSVGCNLTSQITQLVFSADRPNAQFTFCSAAPPNVSYSWSPITNLINPDSLDPQVILDNNTTYFLTVQDSTCEGAAAIPLTINSSFGVSAGPTVSACNGDTIQLNATVTGKPPLKDIVCGINGTVCTQPSQLKTIDLPGMAVSPHTMFPGDTVTGDVPVADARTQILYTANYLLNAGITSGTISQLAFNIYQKNSSLPFYNFNIKMSCTSKGKLDDNTWEPTVLVYSNPTYNTVTGWNTFALQNPYDWDGVSNLVIEFCWNNPDSLPQTNSDILQTQTTNYVAFHTVTSDSMAGCIIPVPTFQYYTEIPQMRVQFCPPPQLPVTYMWSPNVTLSPDSTLTPLVSPSQSTSYTITAEFGGNCAKTSSVNVLAATVIATAQSDTIICDGDSVQLSATGGNFYAWEGAGLSCYTCQSPIASPGVNTNYMVQVTDAASGCNNLATVTVNIVEGITFTPSIAYDTTGKGTAIALTVQASGGFNQYHYTWLPSTYLNQSSGDSVISTPQADIVYKVLVTSGPCVDTATINLDIIESDTLAIPNAFTPNGDGHDDHFYPTFLTGLTTIKTLRIYDRWGQLVYNDPTAPGWDGNFKGAQQPVGTYIYYMVTQVPGQAEKKFEGSVTLLR